jgi:2-methylcitrate dehydratase PrpD
LQTFSETIAQWVANSAFEDLPADVVADTRLRILDVIGLSIAGGATPFGVGVRRTAESAAGMRCRLWGTNETASLTSAAFTNGALSQALEYDDTHNESIVHMSSPAVAAALALVDDRGGSGRDLIRAVAIGNEISSRAGSVAPSQFHKRGFHPSGLFAPFGIACLASAYLGLAPKQATAAMGIVGSFAAGLIQCWVDGTQSKFLHPGWAAQSGISAARLAQEGITGPVEVFEGRFGLFASHMQGGTVEPNFGRLTNELGARWDSRNSSFKPFPAAHVIHPYIDAILRMRARPGLTPDQIARIECPVAPYIVGIVCEPLAEKRRPLTDSHGRVSLQYTLAEALALGKIGRHSYAPASLRDPEILALADRIDFVVDESLPGPEQFKGVVRATLTDGTRIEEIEEHNRGSAINPMTLEEIEGKFRENVDGTLSRESADRLIDAIHNLEKLDDASTITRATVPAHG